MIEETFKKEKKTSKSKHKLAQCTDKTNGYTYLQNKLARERYLTTNFWLRDFTRVLGNSKSNKVLISTERFSVVAFISWAVDCSPLIMMKVAFTYHTIQWQKQKRNEEKWSRVARESIVQTLRAAVRLAFKVNIMCQSEPWNMHTSQDTLPLGPKWHQNSNPWFSRYTNFLKTSSAE